METNWQQPQDLCAISVYKREGRRITIEPTGRYSLENQSDSLKMAAKIGRDFTHFENEWAQVVYGSWCD